MGFASYFNHNRKPNVKIHSIDTENLVKYFITLSDINLDEEMFINYGAKVEKRFGS